MAGRAKKKGQHAKAKPVAKRRPAANAKPGARPTASGGAKLRANADAKPRVHAKPNANAKPTASANPTANAKKTANAKPRARAKPAANAKFTAKTKPTARAKSTPTAKAVAKSKPKPAKPLLPAVADDPLAKRARRLTAREWSTRSSPVVEILDDAHPIGALRRFLDSIKGAATEQQAQIALGAAQLVLLPIAREARGGDEVKELVDLVLERWADFGDTSVGFHAQEFLRNAFAAVGVDRTRIARLQSAVPPAASGELLFHVATAHAVARDKVAMLRAVADALVGGATPADFRRDRDFAPYVADPDLASLLARADLPTIPVDVEPHLPNVRDALEMLVASLVELGEAVELRPPVRLDAILDAERAAHISLPNDYRALLATTNGMRVWDREFLATSDFRDPTSLALRARRYLQAEFAAAGLADCVPLASWGGPNDWLVYDPRGRLRHGDPGYVVMLEAEEIPVADLAAALVWIEALAREERGTN